MKIATWNVNSLKVRLPHLEAWLARVSPDVVCLQETKCEDAKFPGAEIEAMGYRWVHNGQKTYNGVAILAKPECGNVGRGIPEFADEQSRVIAGDVGDTRIVCVYVPNGQSVGSDKYEYKLRWLEALRGWLAAELAAHPKLAVLGDFNIAPEARDVHDPLAWEGQVLVSDAERAALKRLIDLGFADAFRLFEQPEKSFTWWDYRMNAFKRKMGLRIDHVLLSDALAKGCTACAVDVEPRKLERPSDHAPVTCDLTP
ncbi:exodeoxyribonuclease III [Betaproteobacteria bacterium GR16-43]|nr:exodeoxyribonuclease III [Betaproteobacteria bacterium GR16-43]